METFREFVDWLERRGEVCTVSRSVNPKHELTAVMRAMQKGPNKALRFSGVAGSEMPVITNVFGFRKNAAAALGIPEAELLKTLVSLENKDLPTKTVTSVPVQEVVKTDDIDVSRDIPQVVFSELDGGAYITAGILIAKHPETGVYNASWNRCELTGGTKLRARMMPPQHLGRYHAEAEDRGHNLPCAIVIGAPPSLMFSAAAKSPFETDELRVAGAWQGSPLKVARCKTIPVEVPADAEIVIEGEVLAGLREDEGPFGEFTDNYVPIMKNHVFKVSAITHRRDAMYHAILAGGTEDLNVVGIPVQTEIYKKVSTFVPTIKDIATPGYVFGCVISITKQNEDQPKNALLAAMGAYSWTKFVVVVADDVAPFNAADVIWAIQTRSTPDTAIYHVPRVPSYTREDVSDVHRGKFGIDATAPLGRGDLFARRRFPGEEALNLGDYIDSRD